MFERTATDAVFDTLIALLSILIVMPLLAVGPTA